jgi:uncharacterized protein (DUF2147 family)
MLRFVFLALLLIASLPARAAPALTGLWLTRDHGGVMQVSPCDGGLCVSIAGVVLDGPDDPMPMDYRGVSQCRLPLVTDARPDGPGVWKGHITDPRNGQVWGVELRLDPNGDLALRGFLGVPLLGQTQTWTRYDGPVPDDCRLYTPAPVVGQAR